MAYSDEKKNEDEVSRKLFDSSYFDRPLIFQPWNQDFIACLTKLQDTGPLKIGNIVRLGKYIGNKPTTI